MFRLTMMINSGRMLALWGSLLVTGAQSEQPTMDTSMTRVMAFAKRVSPQEAEPLNAAELNQLRGDVAGLGYDDVLDAMDALKSPEGEVVVVPMITPGQPIEDRDEAWKPVARVLADRLIKIAPRHTNRWIQRRGMNSRGAEGFIDRFPKALPEVAWAETKCHYTDFWEETDGGKDYPIPELANDIFHSLEDLNPSPSRRFLLDGSYDDEPFASQLQRDALMGMLRASEHDAEELIDFLDWRIGSRDDLVDDFRSYRFDVDPGARKFTALGLALLAKQDPQKAIDWAEKNRKSLDFEWHYSVYAGWTKFWADCPEELESYLNRREDAIRWLAESVEPDSPAIHNAYFHWRGDQFEQSQKWLDSPSSTSRLKTVKKLLRAKEREWFPPDQSPRK